MSTVQEEWRPVVGYKGFYEVSSLGRVRSLDRLKDNNGGKYVLKGRFLKGRPTKYGYLRVVLFGAGSKPRDALIHRLVAEAFLGPSNRLHVNHIDFDVANNSVENLEYVTPEANVHHSMRAGHTPSGERHANTPLTKADVRAIRATPLKRGVRTRLAEHYGVCKQTITNILTRRTWKHLD